MKPTVGLTRDRLVETLRWIGLAAMPDERPAPPPRAPAAPKGPARTGRGGRP